MKHTDSRKTETAAEFRELKERLSLLEEQVSAIEHLRPLAGNRIKITETGSGLLIEAEEPELSDALKEWILETDKRLDVPRKILTGPGLTAKQDGDGVRIMLNQWQEKNLWEENADTPGTSDFPFRVTAGLWEGGQVEITVAGSNGNNHLHSMVFAGLTQPLEIPEKKFHVSSDTFVLLQITPLASAADNPAPLNAELVLSQEYSSQSGMLLTVPIAQIVFCGHRAVVQQMHFGNVFVAGRII